LPWEDLGKAWVLTDARECKGLQKAERDNRHAGNDSQRLHINLLPYRLTAIPHPNAPLVRRDIPSNHDPMSVLS
jgi:hypothetical protein